MDAFEREAVTQRLLADVAAHYDLGGWRDVRSAPAGLSLTTSAGTFLVTVPSAGRNETSLRFEAMLLAHLEDGAFPAPRLVRTMAGRPWHRCPGGSPVLVTRAPIGRRLDPTSVADWQQGSRALARYHLVVASFGTRFRVDGAPVPQNLLRQGPLVLEALVASAGRALPPAQRDRLRNAATVLWRHCVHFPALRPSDLAALPRLVAHGGFGPEAVVLGGPPPYAEADGLTGFGRARFEVRALDVVAALDAAGEGPGADLARAAAVAAAYGEVGGLTGEEAAAVPILARTVRLTTTLRRAVGFVQQFGLAPPEEREAAEIVDVLSHQAEHLRWWEVHEPVLVEALAPSLVGGRRNP